MGLQILEQCIPAAIYNLIISPTSKPQNHKITILNLSCGPSVTCNDAQESLMEGWVLYFAICCLISLLIDKKTLRQCCPFIHKCHNSGWLNHWHSLPVYFMLGSIALTLRHYLHSHRQCWMGLISPPCVIQGEGAQTLHWIFDHRAEGSKGHLPLWMQCWIYGSLPSGYQRHQGVSHLSWVPLQVHFI